MPASRSAKCETQLARSPCGLRRAACGCASFISKRTVASAPGEPLSLRAVWAASIGSGPVRTPRRAPPEDGYGGKRWNLLGLHPFCGKKVLLAAPTSSRALDLAIDSANKRLSWRRGAVWAAQRGMRWQGPAGDWRARLQRQLGCARGLLCCRCRGHRPRPRSRRLAAAGARRRARSGRAARRPMPTRPRADGRGSERRMVGRGQRPRRRRHRGRDHGGRAAHPLLARAVGDRHPTSTSRWPTLTGSSSTCPDVSFRLAQRRGPAGARPDPGLSLRPVRARQVAHRHRYQGPGARRGGGHRPRRPGSTRSRASTSTWRRPTGRASWPSCRRPRRARRRRAAAIRTIFAGASGPKPNAKPVIVIDAGHGGVDPGAASGEVLEKDVVLAVARHLRTILAAKGRYDVQMTRASDVFVSLDRRLAFRARRARACSSPSMPTPWARRNLARSVRGATVYTLSEQASSRQAQLLADKENAADILAGVETRSTRRGDQVKSILIDLMRRETSNFSADFRAQAAVAPEAHDCARRATRPARRRSRC